MIEKFKDAKINISNDSEILITKTNVKKICPIIYKLKSTNANIAILYFKIDDIKDKKHYIPKIKQDYTLSELKQYLKEVL
ncbi:MAG: hypothetical protein RSA10_01655 [Bacilli bacterium]